MSTTIRKGQNILPLDLKTLPDLYDAYLPFIKGGGLFIATTDSYEAGDQLFIRLSLLDGPDKIPITGKVVWVTPDSCRGQEVSGIGVQFDPDSQDIKRQIEAHLVTSTGSQRLTHTM
ncbi:PilZ domain-containing protein [Endozoicomonas gorgoniicola]|uniref:PilZ domain-containing protein n=1 Tax=Endozoicomonas gorgoniicola TaxID=1234144 RepID=A0ABT3MYQ0_9GAMM|nr:PilZ domain-containing protein [Endozoicomonas gorgoniicola]MCW7554218.1 PilZ domain-containing protein [Endozoicomonas gorgoniicola]